MHFTAGARNRTKKTGQLERQVSLATLRQWRHSPGLWNGPAQTRTLTFLAARVQGFGALTEASAADPEKLCRLMRRAMTPLVQAVKARGGTINRMSAGGFSAFFNAPLDDPDHAVKACDCALAMLSAVDELNRTKAKDADPIHICIGIDTGPGIVGNFGTEDRLDFAAVGRGAERAETLERLCATYGATILASNAVRTQAEARFAFLQLDVLPEEKNETSPLCALLGPPLSRANPKFLALKSFHEHIFQACHALDWNLARKLIGQARALSAADPVLYELYLRRIADYEVQAVAPWRGFAGPAPS